LDLCVGLPDRRFLFGGVGLAAAIEAMQNSPADSSSRCAARASASSGPSHCISGIMSRVRRSLSTIAWARASGSGGTFDHVNPVTGQVQAAIPLAGPSVASASRASAKKAAAPA